MSKQPASYQSDVEDIANDYNAHGDFNSLLRRYSFNPETCNKDGWLIYRQESEDDEDEDEGDDACRVAVKGKVLRVVKGCHCPPFQSGKPYTLFDACALLGHGGDHDAAAKALNAKRSGKPAGGSLNGNGKPAATEEWEEPIPLDAMELPPFPVETLEPWMAEMVEATATALQVPPDLPAMLSLTTLAIAFQRRVEAVVRSGWNEPLSLWTLGTAPPGERKSATYRQMVRPVVDYEADLARRMAEEIVAAQTEHDILTASMEQLKKQAAKAGSSDDRQRLTWEAQATASQLEQLQVPAAPRLTADDTTTERMGMLLAQQGGRMALLSPEGDAFDMMAGRYQNGVANIGVYLRGHAGDTVLVDRVGRPSIVVPDAAISMGLTIQPDVLLGMTTNPTFRGRGLLARFLFAMPKSMVGDREIRPEAIPATISQRYAARLRACLETPAALNEHGKPTPHLLSFAPEADDAIAEFETWLEPQLRPGGELATMEGWASKLAGAVARIATLLHLGSLAGATDLWKIPVDADAVGRARQIAEYLIPHAQAAFAAMGTDPAIKGARTVLGWIKKRGIGEFSKDEAFNSLRSQFPRADDLDEPLKVLLDHGYVRQIEAAAEKRPGRPASPRFRCHPSAQK